MLKQYKKKRDFTKTPEPSGKEKKTAAKGSLHFVIQKHAATRLHYDFRLEANGVLLSWAVPKGVPTNSSVKHMAIQTEDHPLGYANFEGMIPAPGYGAGEVIVWDRGTYAPLNEEHEECKTRAEAEKLMKHFLKEGKMSFHLAGEKLKGIWSLVRFKNDEKNWLMIKHNDDEKIGKINERSVITGRTLKDIKAGIKRNGKKD